MWGSTCLTVYEGPSTFTSSLDMPAREGCEVLFCFEVAKQQSVQDVRTESCSATLCLLAFVRRAKMVSLPNSFSSHNRWMALRVGQVWDPRLWAARLKALLSEESKALSTLPSQIEQAEQLFATQLGGQIQRHIVDELVKQALFCAPESDRYVLRWFQCRNT